jgi:hypothetical protein
MGLNFLRSLLVNRYLLIVNRGCGVRVCARLKFEDSFHWMTNCKTDEINL